MGASPLVHGFYWDDTWYPGGVGDDPEKGMVADMGLTADDLMQLTVSFNANMQALIMPMQEKLEQAMERSQGSMLSVQVLCYAMYCATIELPFRVPYGAHGNWVADSQLQ